MRSLAFCTLSLLAVAGPRLILAQQPLQEIDEGDGSFAIGWTAPPAPAAPPAAPAPPAPPAPAVKAAAPSTTLIAVATPAGNIELNVDAATPTPTPAPSPVQPVANNEKWTSVCGPGSTGTAVTISVTNSHTVAVSMWLNGAAQGSPTPTALEMAAATSFVYPPCVAGNMGFDEVTAGNPAASLIEYSTNWHIDVDVSYVSGYSMPITCYNNNNPQDPFTGCNKDLWSLAKASGIACPGSTTSDGHTCSNPANLANWGYGPPAWFQPCAGQAYTWPHDDSANNSGVSSDVLCCIGSACAAGLPPKAVEAAVNYKIKGRSSEPAASVPDTSAHLRRHKHRHGLKRAHAHHFSG